MCSSQNEESTGLEKTFEILELNPVTERWASHMIRVSTLFIKGWSFCVNLSVNMMLTSGFRESEKLDQMKHKLPIKIFLCSNHKS